MGNHKFLRKKIVSMTKVDIFSGFLGAGKTTLIKKLIAEAYAGEQLVLIENEFGEIGIDGGFLAFALSIAGGIFFVKIFNLFTKKKINPLIGATGLSAVPMASRVANEIALQYDPKNHVLQYCMASNISGVIGSAVAAGVLISFLG